MTTHICFANLRIIKVEKFSLKKIRNNKEAMIYNCNVNIILKTREKRSK